MPRSLFLLFVLVAAGIFAGVWMDRRASTPARQAKAASISPAASPDLSSAALAIATLAPQSGSESERIATRDSQIKILQDQVSYLEQQVKTLQKENSQLIDKLASLTQKPAGTMPSTGQPGPAGDPGHLPDPNDGPDFVGIGIELVKLRGIKDIPIPTMSVPRAEVEKRIVRWLATQVTPEHGKLQGRALAALGVIPEPVDTIALKASFLSHQIGGWYDPADQTLYLAQREEEGITPDNKENALALSYGSLMKRFGPQLYPSDNKVTTLDARLARDSLIAGDAALLRFLHALQNPKTGGGGGVGEDPDDPSRAVPIPNFLREVELLPFTIGFDFMQAMHSIGEWDQVNATYRRPPVACAEALDSRVYLAEHRFTLRPIDLGDVRVKGIEPFWQDTMGPAATVVMLKQRVPQAIASDTAPGWANDKLFAYDAADKSRSHVVWQTLWRDSDAADAFFAAARQWLQGRYKEGRQPAAPPGVFQLDTSERFTHLQRTHGGKGVLFVDGADAAFMKEAAAKFVGAAK
jgi:hypothetical protein